ncbi:MAG: TFIIB-type zinc ribbon-containing protein [Candidatus Hermodarchaeota archaeon]
MDIIEDDSNICPECKKQGLISDASNGIVVCELCGHVVLDNMIDPGAEWRAFDFKEFENKNRVGAPAKLSRYDKGLNTTIPNSNKDGRGNSIQLEKKRELYRLRKLDDKTKKTKSIKRNLLNAMTELERIGSQLGLSNQLKEFAAYIYRKVAHLSKGRSIEAVVLASIYLTGRMNNFLITINDLLNISTIDRKMIMRCYYLILNELRINLNTFSPISLIPKFADQLNLPESTQRSAVDILNVAKKYNILSGRSPASLAGGALYIAALKNGGHCTQSELSSVAGVSESTIRKRYKELIQYFNFEMKKVKENLELKNCDELIQTNIIYWGPPGSGKTANFKHLHNILKNDKITKGFSIDTSNGKTLWQDSLYVSFKFMLEDTKYGLIVNITTIPGIEGFAKARERMLYSADGVIFVADSHRDKMEENKISYNELIQFVKSNKIPLNIQLNKKDIKNAIDLNTFKIIFKLPLEDKYPDGSLVVYEVNALEGKNVVKCFRDLLFKTIFNYFHLNYVLV